MDDEPNEDTREIVGVKSLEDPYGYDNDDEPVLAGPVVIDME